MVELQAVGVGAVVWGFIVDWLSTYPAGQVVFFCVVLKGFALLDVAAG